MLRNVLYLLLDQLTFHIIVLVTLTHDYFEHTFPTCSLVDSSYLAYPCRVTVVLLNHNLDF